MKQKADLPFAILVDGDNASFNKLDEVIRFVAKHGEPIVKNIYADWTKPGMTKWREPAKTHSFRLVQALSYIGGKNTTDIALVIDAMDLLHANTIKGFCFVSSDSDYTPLAQRIREAGLPVLGYGESKTPEAFVKSCHKFVFSDKETEKLNAQEALLQKESELFDKAFDTAAAGKNEVALSLVGTALKKLMPKFKTRRYNCKTLGELYEKLEKYELIQTGEKSISNVVKRR